MQRAVVEVARCGLTGTQCTQPPAREANPQSTGSRHQDAVRIVGFTPNSFISRTNRTESARSRESVSSPSMRSASSMPVADGSVQSHRLSHERPTPGLVCCCRRAANILPDCVRGMLTSWCRRPRRSDSRRKRARNRVADAQAADSSSSADATQVPTRRTLRPSANAASRTPGTPSRDAIDLVGRNVRATTDDHLEDLPRLMKPSSRRSSGITGDAAVEHLCSAFQDC